MEKACELLQKIVLVVTRALLPSAPQQFSLTRQADCKQAGLGTEALPGPRLLPSTHSCKGKVSTDFLSLATISVVYLQKKYKTIGKHYFLNYFIILTYLLVVLHDMWDLSSLTRDRTHTPCSGGAES